MKKRKITQPGLNPLKKKTAKMPSGTGIYRKANSHTIGANEVTPALGRDVCNLGMEQILFLMEQGKIKNILFVAIDDEGNTLSGLKINKTYGPEFVQIVQTVESLQKRLLETPVEGLNESSYVDLEEDLYEVTK